MRVLNNLLTLALGLVVLWSVVGVSVQEHNGQSHYALYWKSTPV